MPKSAYTPSYNFEVDLDRLNREVMREGAMADDFNTQDYGAEYLASLSDFDPKKKAFTEVKDRD